MIFLVRAAETLAVADEIVQTRTRLPQGKLTPQVERHSYFMDDYGAETLRRCAAQGDRVVSR